MGGGGRASAMPRTWAASSGRWQAGLVRRGCSIVCSGPLGLRAGLERLCCISLSAPIYTARGRRASRP
eukprot:10731010-Alexandrium_andersonii.AAC.1